MGGADTSTYVSVSEAASLLGVNRVSVWRWIRAGLLPVSRFGRRTTRIRRADLETLVSHTRAHPRLSGRHSGVPIDGPDHVVQFYESDRFLIERVADFIRPALEGDDAAVVVATSEHRRALDRRLRAAGLDVLAGKAQGRYVSIDAASTLRRFVPDGAVDRELFLGTVGPLIAGAARGGRSVRVFGEMVALLAGDGSTAAALELEGMWNVLLERERFTLFCAYPIRWLGNAEFAAAHADVCAAHGAVIPAESYTAAGSPEEQARVVSGLQQRAQWLEAEVAERKRAEADLQRALESERGARKSAEHALRLRDEFLSVASHELRTPVASLSIQAQTMLRRLERDGGLEPSGAAHALQAITGQADKLSRLLNQLMDVTRLETGKVHLLRQATDISDLVGHSIEIARSLASADPHHRFIVDVPEILVAEVDALRLEQVLTNLLDNAVKFSPDGGDIHVAVRRSGSDWFEISVRDFGLGIPIERRDHIFQRFYQAHADTHRSGMGLGLYVSQQIVEMHAGKLHAEFPAGGGSRFILRLPFRL
jgi:excisionase family DNA binding protein